MHTSSENRQRARMSCFQDIPHHIFQYMQDYLQTKLSDYITYQFGKKNNYYDDKYWRNFMNTCKTLQEVKTVTIYLKLNLKYSQRFIHDLNFREIVLQRVKRPSVQIGLDLVNYKVEDVDLLAGINGLNCIDLSFSDINSVSMLGNVTHLLLCDCPKLVYASSLTNLHTLDLSSCRQVHNESILSLGNISYLDLSGCEKISDVSCLGGNRTLKLRGCKLISDVSMLGRVYELDLDGCVAVRDVSALGKVHRLSIARCTVTDISALGQVHTLDISELKVESVAFLTGVKKLKAVKCSSLKGFLGLEEVEELDMTGCLVHDVTPLSKVHTLTLGYLRRPYYYGQNADNNNQPVNFDVSVLQQLKVLHVRGYLQKIEGICKLKGLETLTLTHRSASFVNESLPPTCRKVIVADFAEAGMGNYFENVKDAEIISSYSFRTVQTLRNVQKLHLAHCSGIKEIESLAWLVDLTIIDCSSLSGIDFATLPNLETVFIESVPCLKELEISGKKLRSVTVTRSGNLKTVNVKKALDSLRLFDCNNRVKISVESHIHELVLICQDQNYKLKVSKKGKIGSLVVDVDED